MIVAFFVSMNSISKSPPLGFSDDMMEELIGVVQKEDVRAERGL